MTKVQLVNSVTSAFYKAKFQLEKHSPEILIVGGAIGIVTSAVLACRATLKVNDVLDEAKENIEKIHTSVETGTTPGGQLYSVEDSKKELAVTYIQTGAKLAKLYALPVTLGALSMTCMFTSHKILTTRNSALTAAYIAVDKGFREYRDRVVERFGKEVDQELKYDLQKREIETTVVDENGKEKTVKETVTVVGPGGQSEYARFFDESCPDWHKNPEYNRMFLQAQQQWANDMLVTRKYLFLNDVYKALGMEETASGQVVGWIYDPENPDHKGANYVDFGMFIQTGNDIYDIPKRRFVNGYERTILLDFNVDPEPILNKAFKKR